MYIVTKEGQMRPHTDALESQLISNQVDYCIVDISIFPDIEWEFISALKPDYVYTYVTTKAAERNDKKN
jgi:hypothetical protein